MLQQEEEILIHKLKNTMKLKSTIMKEYDTICVSPNKHKHKRNKSSTYLTSRDILYKTDNQSLESTKLTENYNINANLEVPQPIPSSKCPIPSKIATY